jgi:N-methylhydantoinase A
MGFIVGIDIGGTFTDAVAVNVATGRVLQAKTPTTPDDLTDGVIVAIDELAQGAGLQPQELLGQTVKFVHGTTQSSNIMFTWTGARTGLLATRGFGDQVLIMRAIGRVAGRSLSDRRHFRTMDKPPAIVPKERIREVAERVDYKGDVLVALDLEDARQAIRELIDEGVDAIAIALLWSFRNPVHEKALAELVRDLAPGVHVTRSSEIAPVIGEYERTSTAVVNAYVSPLMVEYLGRLEARLGEAGLTRRPLILQASGGVTQVDHTVPVNTIESGPAAGVVGAKLLADETGYQNLIATDVGGTTFKVSLLVDGEWSFAREAIINQYHLAVPMIDMVSIGSGGGSVAWIDSGQRLRIGPQSAGADPGPVSYGRGGTEPTVTDADVVLGFIDPNYFLGGRIRLDRQRAASAIQTRVADELFGGDLMRAAAGIRMVVDAQMSDLVRKATIERGHDPRDFALLAYGGAGPLHAASYGREIGVTHLVVPLTATVYSAWGAAASDLRHTFKDSFAFNLPGDPAIPGTRYDNLERQARELLRRQDVDESDIAIARWAEVRYRRQMHEVRIPVPTGTIDPSTLEAIGTAFEARYEALYGQGTAYREAGIEIVTFGVDAVGRTERPALPRFKPTGAELQAARRSSRSVYWPELGRAVETAVFDGSRLEPEMGFNGPAIVEMPGTTVVVPDGDRAEIDEFLNILITLGGAHA